MKEQKRRRRHVTVVAAVLCLIVALTCTAVATDFFGLRQWLMPEKAAVQMPDGQGGLQDVRVDSITLSGYADTPESRATAEWQAFLGSYDPDGSILREIGNGPTGLEERYRFYQVYTREMADTLDGITERCGLVLHTGIQDVMSREDLFSKAGGAFLAESHTPFSTYIYEDGTFHYDGEAYVEGFGILSYQFMRCVRGSFTDVMLAVGDVSAYREWGYTASCGQEVRLGIGPGKALVLAELRDSFVTLNVLAGGDDGLTAGELEALADGIDFSLLDRDREELARLAAVPRAEETGELAEEDLFYGQTGMEEQTAQEFYAEFVRAIEDGRRLDVAEMICWPAKVTTADGTATVETAKDFLDEYDSIVTESLLACIHENQYDENRADLFGHDGLAGAAGGAVWFTCLEDGTLAVLTIQTPEGWSVRPVWEDVDG
ncbi:hypothetical protein KQI82_02265 [Oscillibacter sp. MSJ-2]|uniref:Uncharacterized protein n=1 Tax=Dysosmobacter acutus TaxID=2841504 RepID=A0ABS6F634_9FIRM|nr:hypothetical protein [Dysosmobacter acutus]MBU5625758.1 hypothetical protein [Dysosmobacter acutus]